MKLNIYDIVTKPSITEKYTRDQDTLGKYAFEVNPYANKKQIRAAVEKIFNVHVMKVHTMNHHGKWRRVRREAGKTAVTHDRQNAGLRVGDFRTGQGRCRGEAGRDWLQLLAYRDVRRLQDRQQGVEQIPVRCFLPPLDHFLAGTRTLPTNSLRDQTRTAPRR